jgi:hypothetical protein
VRTEPINADPPAHCAPSIVDCDRTRVRRARAPPSAHDQPRVSRLLVHVTDCPLRG